MKKSLLTIVLFFSLANLSFAQWKTRLGANVLLLPLRTLEVTAEFQKHPAYSLTLHTGYVHRSGYAGLGGMKVNDMIDERCTSGWFGKVGGRLYPLSLTGNELATNFFIGAQVIASGYNQSGVRRDDMNNSSEDIKASGLLAGGALTGGLTFKLSKRFRLETGVQYGFQPWRDDYLGNIDKNYQPGFGISRAGKSVRSIQGFIILSFLL
ncbi:hypothetical protein BWI96_09905 [Siphonobacter sp. SORGH_AS_0500]|uniref:DUF3575 domain-containing protein n=1 Tax=Siphonobacter sp. SORGH_AS_0500 TaxID=1864824 RepID=UPI000CBD6BB9|nr:DUF3575 domain-containing protein [Siphonobacter sp. SORGH_AS_0500]PKK36685.1 hypothetical protein BWI96_09905 [Siphonobacter sp. SORGH_AS_0500]